LIEILANKLHCQIITPINLMQHKAD